MKNSKQKILLGLLILLLLIVNPVYACMTISSENMNKIDNFSHSKLPSYGISVFGYNTARRNSLRTSDSKDNYVGYASAMAEPSGEIVAQTYDGYARPPCDGNGFAAFNLDTMAPWGSVTKVITTATVLRALRQRNNVNLDSRFIDYLPLRWRNEVNSRFANVTIRHLLSHRGGFKHKAGYLPNKPSEARARLRDGEPGSNCRPILDRCYSNINMGMINYIFGYIMQPNEMQRLENSSTNLSNKDYDRRLADRSGNMFHDFMVSSMQSIGVTATCNISSLSSRSNYTRWYNAPPRIGKTINIPDRSHACAQGALVMSTRGMIRFLHAISASEDYISHADYQLMTSGDSLGFGSANTGRGVAYVHNGVWRETSSNIAVLPTGQLVAAVSNSLPTETGQHNRSREIGMLEAYQYAHQTGKGSLNQAMKNIVSLITLN